MAEDTGETTRQAIDTTIPNAVGSPQVGDLGPRYRIDSVIGMGGMGEVISARDEQIGRMVAIKRMRTQDVREEAHARFMREALIQGRLEHPAVVPVHELYHDDTGQPFFVMKQLAGTTLADVLEDLATGEAYVARKFPRQRLLRAFVDVCLAIEFANTRGVVHRDLKPANIMLGDFGEVYVLDWGIARVVDDATRTSFADIDTLAGATLAGAVYGTPGYMPPEQVRGDTGIDCRADVYGLGCILFEILSGEALHPRGQAGMASALAGTDARPSHRRHDRDVPPELDALCVAATMLESRERIASARELSDAVQLYLDGDRDVALRRALAVTALADAHAALARGNGPAERREAIRAAAKALALDPYATAPAELVARLMLEPPADMPPEVEAALKTGDDQALYASRPLMMAAGCAYLAFFAILFWTGFREPAYLAAGIILSAIVGLNGLLATRENVLLSGYIVIASNALMIALLARIGTPFLVAPGIAVVTAMSIATDPRLLRAWQLAVVLVGAVIVPWLLEVVGVLSPTMTFAGSSLILHSSAGEIDPRGAMVALVLYVIAIVTLGILLARAQASARRIAQRTVQLQAWQLHQLVPS
jgi:tRNA A-37 threonylcarbamoyl transferase component Bud32